MLSNEEEFKILNKEIKKKIFNKETKKFYDIDMKMIPNTSKVVKKRDFSYCYGNQYDTYGAFFFYLNDRNEGFYIAVKDNNLKLITSSEFSYLISFESEYLNRKSSAQEIHTNILRNNFLKDKDIIYYIFRMLITGHNMTDLLSFPINAQVRIKILGLILLNWNSNNGNFNIEDKIFQKPFIDYLKQFSNEEQNILIANKLLGKYYQYSKVVEKEFISFRILLEQCMAMKKELIK